MIFSKKYKNQNDRNAKIYRFKTYPDPFSLKNLLLAGGGVILRWKGKWVSPHHGTPDSAAIHVPGKLAQRRRSPRHSTRVVVNKAMSGGRRWWLCTDRSADANDICFGADQHEKGQRVVYVAANVCDYQHLVRHRCNSCIVLEFDR